MALLYACYEEVNKNVNKFDVKDEELINDYLKKSKQFGSFWQDSDFFNKVLTFKEETDQEKKLQKNESHILEDPQTIKMFKKLKMGVASGKMYDIWTLPDPSPVAFWR